MDCYHEVKAGGLHSEVCCVCVSTHYVPSCHVFCIILKGRTRRRGSCVTCVISLKVMNINPHMLISLKAVIVTLISYTKTTSIWIIFQEMTRIDWTNFSECVLILSRTLRYEAIGYHTPNAILLNPNYKP